MNVEITEEDRQMVVLSLALTALLRPGFDYAAREIARRFEGEQMFTQFKELNDGHVVPQHAK